MEKHNNWRERSGYKYAPISSIFNKNLRKDKPQYVKKSQIRFGTERVYHLVSQKLSAIKKEQLEEIQKEADKNANINVNFDQLFQKENFHILNEFMTRNISIESLLNVKDKSCSQLLLNMKLLAKACKAADASLVSKMLHKLAMSKNVFVMSVSILMGKKLAKTTDFDLDEFLETVFELLEALLQNIPTFSFEILELLLPQLDNLLQNTNVGDQFKTSLLRLHELKSLQNKLIEEFDTTPDKGFIAATEEFLPPSDFRTMSVIPLENEILNPHKPYLRPLVTDRAYNDVDHYLDIHFRLIREDLFYGFRQCIAQCKSGHYIGNMENGNLYYSAKFEKLEFSSSDVAFVFSVQIDFMVNWETSKRLAPGSLICISNNKFESFNFATIDSRKPYEGVSSCCTVNLIIESGEKMQLSSFLFIDIIETNAFFESYRHLLERFQKLRASNFPLGESLINFIKCNELPVYAFNKEIKNGFVTLQKEIADIHQSEAFELAFCNKVALIQGPPGTGKTYLGLKIAKHLVQNNLFHKPILVMCYTNHALDQFLENILKFTSKVVRIGGQSKSQKLKPRNLNSIAQSVNNFFKCIDINDLGGCFVVQNDMESENCSFWHSKRFCDYDCFDTLIDNVLDFVPCRVCGTVSGNYCKRCSIRQISVKKAEKVFSDPDNIKSLYIAKELTNERFSCNKLLRRSYAVMKSAQKEACSVMDLIQAQYFPFENPATCKFVLNEQILRKLLSSKTVNYSKFDFTKNFKKVFKKIQQWLLFSPTSFHAYDKNIKFRRCIIIELLNFMHLKPGLEKKNVLFNGTGQMDHLAELLLRICDAEYETSCGDSSSLDESLPSGLPNKKVLKQFIQRYLFSNAHAFHFFVKGAEKCVKLCNINIDHECDDIWELGILERWRLIGVWIEKVVKNLNSNLEEPIRSFKNDARYLKSKFSQESLQYLLGADIIGLTTTGASKNWDLIKTINPQVCIVEEAAEVLESQIVASLVPSIEHLILIGDHEQLKPSSSVYDLEVNYKLNVSLFERLIKNGVPSKCLQVQHRMRPLIAELLVPEFYKILENHPSVTMYEDIRGMSSNVFFKKHNIPEDETAEHSSHSNLHEAQFLVTLCHYLLQQGHNPSTITILTTYVGQLSILKKLMSNKCLQNVAVTTVDNFQGEENDIILLSFVRSNDDDKIGFIKTSNRICVALSRARKGLYCIGNFDMFSLKSNIWKKLICKLRKKFLIGESLQLQCQNHPDVKFSIHSATELQRVINKGCSKPCNTFLCCGHFCVLPCHLGNTEHKCYYCDIKHISQNFEKAKPMTSIAEIPHSLQTIEMEHNFEHIEKEIPKSLKEEGKIPVKSNLSTQISNIGEDSSSWAHNVSLLERDFKYVDTEIVTEMNTFRISNTKLTTEKENNGSAFLENEQTHSIGLNYTTSVDNSTLVEKLLPCLHMAWLCPEQDAHTFLCSVEIREELPCGHNTIVPCNLQTKLSHIKCKEIVVKYMKCGKEEKYICGDELEHEDCDMQFMLQCGHEAPCNSDILFYKCLEHVQHTCAFGHIHVIPCEAAANSAFRCEAMTSVTLACGHTTEMPCSLVAKKSVKCKVFTSQTLPCGHIGNVLCSSDLEETQMKCEEICGVHLACGHHCTGICGMCFSLQVHKSCEEIKDVTLLCGFTMKLSCGAPLQICEEMCKFQCSHTQCINPCGIPCIMCKKPCDWKCEHFQCGRMCGEPCDRPPCDHPCLLPLQCGHLCAGFCGEPCPTLCLICSDMNNTYGFVLLEDCGHAIKEIELSKYLQEVILHTYPQCPECFTAITKNVRFGNLIKSYKKQLILNTQKTLKETDYQMLLFFKPYVSQFEYEFIIQGVLNNCWESSIHFTYLCKVSKLIKNILIIFCTKSVISKSKYFQISSKIKSKINLLELWLNTALLHANEQQVEDSCRAVRHIAMLIFIKVQKRFSIFSPNDRVNELWNDVERHLESTKYGKHEEEIVLNLVNNMQAEICVESQKLMNFISELNS